MWRPVQSSDCCRHLVVYYYYSSSLLLSILLFLDVLSGRDVLSVGLFCYCCFSLNSPAALLCSRPPTVGVYVDRVGSDHLHTRWPEEKKPLHSCTADSGVWSGTVSEVLSSQITIILLSKRSSWQLFTLVSSGPSHCRIKEKVLLIYPRHGKSSCCNKSYSKRARAEPGVADYRQTRCTKTTNTQAFKHRQSSLELEEPAVSDRRRCWTERFLALLGLNLVRDGPRLPVQ